MKNIIKIYILNYNINNIKISKQKIKKLIKYMPNERIKKYNRLIQSEKKLNCLFSYILLWYVLHKNFNIAQPKKLQYKKNGKPYIDTSKKLFFNISHTNNSIICGIAKSEIGVDAENIRHINFGLVKKICTDEEYSYFLKSPNKNETFFNIWTKKESAAKQKDISIFKNFKNINSLRLKNTKTIKYKNLIISISCSEIKKIKLKNISNVDFFRFIENKI